MDQNQRREYLIRRLADESLEYEGMEIPSDINDQKQVLRSLMNIRRARPISAEFEKIQDEYLKVCNEERGIVCIDDIHEMKPSIYLWQGDITKLKVGAIVNAANSGMTGCYNPCHNCIDNCIHTYAGIQLRNYCNDLMLEQEHEEESGKAKITPAFNLPCNHIIHTVGPIVYETLNEEHESLLKSCYRSCLEIADKNDVESIAFCCISTGVFMFPNGRAAQIAVDTVREYIRSTGSSLKVIFNVFKDEDLAIYRELLK